MINVKFIIIKIKENQVMPKATSSIKNDVNSIQELSADNLLEKLFCKYDFDNNKRISKF